MDINYKTTINSEKLKKLILTIYEYRDKISKNLEDSKQLVDSTKDFYKSQDGEEYRKKFEIFYDNYLVFLENIKSYGLDLEYILTSYMNMDKKNVDTFKKEWYN